MDKDLDIARRLVFDNRTGAKVGSPWVLLVGDH